MTGILAGCTVQGSDKEQSCTKNTFAMDTVMQFTAYGEKSEAAVDAAIEEVNRLDGLLSTGSPSSEVSRINREGQGMLSDDTGSLLESAMTYYEETGGLFDFTIYPLMKLWGFTTKEYYVPSEEELRETLGLVDAGRVTTDGTTVTLGEGQEIDFGGIAKGYTSARVMEIFREYGVAHALVSLGGNVQTLGTKPDGSRWRIGIQDPDSTRGATLAVVSVEDQAVVTSGGYERYFEQDGTTYIHIVDPRTGYPVKGDLVSVTIVSRDGTMADALSTSLYIMGLEDAEDYWREHREEFDCVLLTTDGEFYVSKGLEEYFQSEQKSSIFE